MHPFSSVPRQIRISVVAAVLKALKSMPCLESILVGSIDADTSFASQLPLKQMSSSAPNPANPGAAGLMGFA